MQPATEQTVLGNFDQARVSHRGVTSTFFRRDGKFFVRTDGPDGKPGEFEITYTFGVTPLQQYLVPFPDGRLQALGLAWDTRPRDAGGQRWFPLYPDVDAARPRSPPLDGAGADVELPVRRVPLDGPPEAVRPGVEPLRDDVGRAHRVVRGVPRAGLGPRRLGREAPGRRAPRGAGHHRPRRAPRTGRRRVDHEGHPARHRRVDGPRRGPRRSSTSVRAATRAAGRSPILTPTAGPFLDTHVPALLEARLYHPDGQILGEVYEWGSFVQSRMHRAGVTCSDCHEPHRGTLRAPGNGVCAQCHLPAKFDVATPSPPRPGPEAARCVSCHMPARTYMVVDPRRDHSLRVPRPDLSAALGHPERVHGLSSGPRARSGPPTASRRGAGLAARRRTDFARTLDAARRGLPDAGPALIALANDRNQPGIVRATALSHFPEFSTPAMARRGERAPRRRRPGPARGASRRDALPAERRGAAGRAPPPRSGEGGAPRRGPDPRGRPAGAKGQRARLRSRPGGAGPVGAGQRRPARVAPQPREPLRAPRPAGRGRIRAPDRPLARPDLRPGAGEPRRPPARRGTGRGRRAVPRAGAPDGARARGGAPRARRSCACARTGCPRRSTSSVGPRGRGPTSRASPTCTPWRSTTPGGPATPSRSSRAPSASARRTATSSLRSRRISASAATSKRALEYAEKLAALDPTDVAAQKLVETLRRRAGALAAPRPPRSFQPGPDALGSRVMASAVPRPATSSATTPPRWRWPTRRGGSSRPALEHGFSVETKLDRSLVTDVDRAVERRWRELIERWFPDHGALGEEYPPTRPASAFQWIMDPIDGTEEFVHGIPTFGTMLALHHRGVPLVGVIDHPALDIRVNAGVGLGTHRNGRRVRLDDAPASARPEDVRLVLSARINFTRHVDEGPLFERAHPRLPEPPDLPGGLRPHRRRHGRRRRHGGHAQPRLGPGPEPGAGRGGRRPLRRRPRLRVARGPHPERRLRPAGGGRRRGRALPGRAPGGSPGPGGPGRRTASSRGPSRNGGTRLDRRSQADAGRLGPAASCRAASSRCPTATARPPPSYYPGPAAATPACPAATASSTGARSPREATPRAVVTCGSITIATGSKPSASGSTVGGATPPSTFASATGGSSTATAGWTCRRQETVRLPAGSYRESCRDFSVENRRLEARCRRKNGDWRDTAIDLTRCKKPDPERRRPPRLRLTRRFAPLAAVLPALARRDQSKRRLGTIVVTSSAILLTPVLSLLWQQVRSVPA